MPEILAEYPAASLAVSTICFVKTMTNINSQSTIQTTVCVNRHQVPLVPTSIGKPLALSNDISVAVRSVGGKCAPYRVRVTVDASAGIKFCTELLLIMNKLSALGRAA